MAKNKRQNRDRKHTPAAERGKEEAQKTSMEAQSKTASVTPGDVARKHRERRFGHN